MWDKFTDNFQGKFLVGLMIFAIISALFLLPLLLFAY